VVTEKPGQAQTLEVSERASTAPALSQRFRLLFDGEFAYICRALQRLGVRETDLKDVAQELLIAVHNHLDSFDDSRPLRPWLFGFALRFAQNYRRLALHSRSHVPADELADAPRASAEFEARETVLRALQQLDYDQRIVLVMHDLEGFAAPEIAERIDAKLNTVYSRLRLAREHFRAAVLAAAEEAP
jgi:RNA polymerase sigma-70 factor (ECF subfamily)